jgi:hypothetical protein
MEHKNILTKYGVTWNTYFERRIRLRGGEYSHENSKYFLRKR